ncbi:DUF1801 domain-containing protein [Algibacter sp. 2305UL17-15]|uniref:DUF1801 domain-containing protein n=1 Tax=Algibacter sp. 2305UL17-15 TaxID=3231268 RepID=UPI003459993E
MYSINDSINPKRFIKMIELNTDPKVATVFNNYPKNIKEKLLHLRALVLETANETETITQLEETLKWGEPSYITKIGSTIRIDWKAKTPNQYAMYFKCTSKLVSTFKVQYTNTFNFEGSRAIVFNLEDEIPEEALKNCIKAALTYHKVKHLPSLGI